MTTSLETFNVEQYDRAADLPVMNEALQCVAPIVSDRAQALAKRHAALAARGV